MRRIKFRGKGLLPDYKGKWVYGYYKKYAHGKDYIEDEHGNVFLVDPETVSQLVEVSRDGTEYYEGDILQEAYDDTCYWTLYWDDDEHAFRLNGDGAVEHSELLERMIVVGNIFDDKLEDFTKEVSND